MAALTYNNGATNISTHSAYPFRQYLSSQFDYNYFIKSVPEYNPLKKFYGYAQCPHHQIASRNIYDLPKRSVGTRDNAELTYKKKDCSLYMIPFTNHIKSLSTSKIVYHKTVSDFYKNTDNYEGKANNSFETINGHINRSYFQKIHVGNNHQSRHNLNSVMIIKKARPSVVDRYTGNKQSFTYIKRIKSKTRIRNIVIQSIMRQLLHH